MLTFTNLMCRVQQGKYATNRKKHTRNEKHTWIINNNEDLNMLHIPNNGEMYNKTDDRKTLLNKQNTGWEMNPKETLYISAGR